VLVRLRGGQEFCIIPFLEDCTLFSVLEIDLIFCVAHLAGDSLLDIVLVDLNLLAQLAWLANLMLIIFSNFRSSLGGLERDPKARLSSLHIFR
jgi:hypothetical protein